MASGRRRAIVRGAILLVATLLLAEGAVRAAAFLLRRDDAVSARSGEGVVYCIGDSFTYGQGVRPEEAWPRVLGRLLEEAAPGRAPEIRTLAVPGNSSSVALADLAKVLQAGDARLVLILAGWNANDGDFAEHAAERSRPVPWSARLDLWLSSSRLYRVVKQALTLRSRELVLDDVRIVPQTTAMSLYDFTAYQEIAARNLREMARLCRAAGVPCAFLTYPHQPLPPNPYTETEYYHALFGRTPLSERDYLVHDRKPGEIAIDAVIRTVAESEGVPLIDVQPAFAGGKGMFLADYHHPTAAGHVRMARAVFDRVGGALVGTAGATGAAAGRVTPAASLAPPP